MSVKRDIANDTLREMVSDPAVAGILQSFDFGDDVESRKARIREAIAVKRAKRLREEEDEFSFDDVDAEDLDMEGMDDMDLDMEEEDGFDEESFDEEGFDEEEFEDADDPLTALDAARAALDTVEDALESEDTEIDFDEEDLEGDLDLDAIDADEADEDLEESVHGRRSKRIKEAIRRARIKRKVRELRSRKIGERKPLTESQKRRKLIKQRIAEQREKVAGSATKKSRALEAIKEARARRRRQLLAEYARGRKTLRVIEERMLKISKGFKSGKIHEAGKSKLYKAKYLEMKKDRATLQRAVAQLREALFSTGGPAPGEQVSFPKMPKKTKTGIQKQSNTKTEFPKKPKAPEKGHKWPSHGSAATSLDKKPGQFPGKAIARTK